MPRKKSTKTVTREISAVITVTVTESNTSTDSEILETLKIKSPLPGIKFYDIKKQLQ